VKNNPPPMRRTNRGGPHMISANAAMSVSSLSIIIKYYHILIWDKLQIYLNDILE